MISQLSLGLGATLYVRTGLVQVEVGLGLGTKCFAPQLMQVVSRSGLSGFICAPILMRALSQTRVTGSTNTLASARGGRGSSDFQCSPEP